MNKPEKNLREDIYTCALTALWLLLARFALGASWGLFPEVSSTSTVDAGILHNANDTWFYLSIAQQYSQGAGLAGDLYTTEPHSALLWALPLWVVGLGSRLTDLPIVGVYNVAGLVGALIAVFAFRRVAWNLDLPRAARNISTAALVFGTGSAWLIDVRNPTELIPRLTRPEMFFLDLFPSTAFLTYPYHSFGLALLCTLWWRTACLETRLLSGQFPRSEVAVVGGLALLMAFSRPYEPLAFFAAWSVKTLWHFIQRKSDPAAWRISYRVALLLGITLVPGIVWSGWTATRPVWSGFASAALSLGVQFKAHSWLVCLAGLTVLGLIGAHRAWRANPRAAVLPVSACGLVFTILVLFGSGQAKLASGLLLGPMLLAGWAGHALWEASARSGRAARAGLVLLVVVLLGAPSAALNFASIRALRPPPLDEPLVRLAQTIPRSSLPSVVLTSPRLGEILPGLVGARVFAGHWALTDNFRAKANRLATAGLVPDKQPATVAEMKLALDHLVAEVAFDFALLEPATPALEHLIACRWTPVAHVKQWTLLAAPARPPAPFAKRGS